MFENNITTKDLKVFEYVNEHPGSSQEEIVRGMSGNPSRITIINILKRLEGYNMIVRKKDKPNSQIYRIYVNSDDLLATAQRTLDDLKKSFSFLFSNSQKKINEIYSERKSGVKVEDITPLLSELLRIHTWTTHSSVHCNLEWEWIWHIQDKVVVNRLYHLVFESMVAIFDESSRLFLYLSSNKINQDVHLDMDKILPRSFPSSFIPNKESIRDSLEIFGKYGLRAEAMAAWEAAVKFRNLK